MADPVSLAALAPIATVVVMIEIAAGTTVAAYTVDLLGKVGRGFAGTTALICAGIMAVDVLIEGLLPSGTALLGSSLPPGSQASLFDWSIAFTIALVGYALFCAVGTDPARRVVGLITIGFGAMAIAKSAAAFGPSLGGVVTAAVAFVPAALVAGSALAGMLLGHWYLVAPNLSFRPLRRAIDIVFAAVALQLVVIVLVVARTATAVRGELLTGTDAVPFWLSGDRVRHRVHHGRRAAHAPLRQDSCEPAGHRDALRPHHQRGDGSRPGAPAVLPDRRPDLIPEIR